jgi:hypothetical protein
MATLEWADADPSGRMNRKTEGNYQNIFTQTAQAL